MNYLKKFYGKTMLDNSDSEDIINYCELEYYQIENELSEKPYGIEIIKKNIENEKMKIESNVIYNIYKSEIDNNNLINKLIKNKVTPIALNDVVDDFLSQ